MGMRINDDELMNDDDVSCWSISRWYSRQSGNTFCIFLVFMHIFDCSTKQKDPISSHSYSRGGLKATQLDRRRKKICSEALSSHYFCGKQCKGGLPAAAFLLLLEEHSRALPQQNWTRVPMISTWYYDLRMTTNPLIISKLAVPKFTDTAWILILMARLNMSCELLNYNFIAIVLCLLFAVPDNDLRLHPFFPNAYNRWYHGRSKEMDSDKKLPPLSTGRIGRATSKNGLHWVKDDVGSDSEDHEGVSLGLNKDSWWGFDTAHLVRRKRT